MKKPTSFERIAGSVTFVSSLIVLVSGAAGLWLLWPQISESIIGARYQIAYDYVVVPATALSCVAKPDATLKIDLQSVGLLQNECQATAIAGAANNDLFRVWYVRVANKGPEIPKVTLVQTDERSSSFSLGADDATLACLGYEGRPGRQSQDWRLTKFDLLGADGDVRTTVVARPAPAPDQLRGAVSDCTAAFVGYPPL